MRLFVLATAFTIAGIEFEQFQGFMEQGFYPALLLILVTASLGIPIPEDIPLIAAGVILKTSPETASWHGTFIVALIGIMTGDLVLYSLGKHWGRGVVNHRLVRWMITPERFDQVSEQFQRHGAWFCFFGRFFMGIRAVMCITAGATRFPYWRFFLADFAGALLSVPLFVVLGYFCAGMIPTLLDYMSGVQIAMSVIAVIGVIIAIMIIRRRRKKRRQLAEQVMVVEKVIHPDPNPAEVNEESPRESVNSEVTTGT